MSWQRYLAELKNKIEHKLVHSVAKSVLTNHEYSAFICEYEHNCQNKSEIGKCLKISPYRANELIKGYRRKLTTQEIYDIFDIKKRQLINKNFCLVLELADTHDLFFETFKILPKHLGIFFNSIPCNSIQANLVFLLNKKDVIFFYLETKNKYFISRKNISNKYLTFSELEARFYISADTLKSIKPLVNCWGGDLNIGYELIE